MEVSGFVKCRLCRKKHDYSIDIFDPAGTNNLLVWKVIKEITGLEVSKDDGLPSALCLQCMEKLTEFKNFKMTCIKSRIEFLTEMVNNGIVGTSSETLPLDFPMPNILTLPKSTSNTVSCRTEESDPLYGPVDVKPVIKDGIIVEDQHSGYKRDKCSDQRLITPTVRRPENERPSQLSDTVSENLSPGSSKTLLSPSELTSCFVALKRFTMEMEGKDAEVDGCARTSGCNPRKKQGGHRGLPNSLSAKMLPNPYHGLRSQRRRQIVSMTPEKDGRTPRIQQEQASPGPRTGLRESSRCPVGNSRVSFRSQIKKRPRSVPASSSWYEVVTPPNSHSKKGKTPGNICEGSILKDCWVVLNDISSMKGCVDSSAVRNQKRSNSGGEKNGVGNVKRRSVKIEPLDTESGSCVLGEDCRTESDGKAVKFMGMIKGGRYSIEESSTVRCRTLRHTSFKQEAVQRYSLSSHPKGMGLKTCSLCNRNFARPSLLRLHMRNHVAGLPFSCKKCPCGFRNEGALVYHMMCIHPEVRRSL